jgi:hypothetical protein
MLYVIAILIAFVAVYTICLDLGLVDILQELQKIRKILEKKDGEDKGGS